MRTVEKGVVVNGSCGCRKQRHRAYNLALWSNYGYRTTKPSELWHDKPHPQQTSRHGKRLDSLISVTSFTTLILFGTKLKISLQILAEWKAVTVRLRINIKFYIYRGTRHSSVRILIFSVHIRPWILASDPRPQQNCNLWAAVSPRPQRL